MVSLVALLLSVESEYTAIYSNMQQETKIPNATESEYTAIYSNMQQETKIPNATESEYTAIYSNMQQENKDTERNGKRIYSDIQ